MTQGATLAVNREVAARTVLIGGQISTEGKEDIYHVVLLGVSGFLSKNQLADLLTPIGRKTSPIQPLHDKFVVTVKFIDSVKMTLSHDELQVLQAEARKAMG